ncbi:conserved hypothetical protein [Gloeothece citriformis PCC 7424]|uniref:Phosphate ABC transporter permease n=1 Tax=Gloeothece citriformis (strain PCC 7424) TaxID=65393 RepID=B7KBV5_GLOC7|nr:hypothetical protein [Gloeothece citriformis]ACK68778.1 conserved hypothetical protein [Gloeothece citriformis PCC 7424]
MLIPITRQTFEQIIPIIATGPQYAHYWGTWQDFLRRLLISVVALTVTWLLGMLFGKGGMAIKLLLDIIAGLYWLWAPVYWASLRNGKCRRLPYSGFWRGRVLDAFITEDLVKEEETFDKTGQLVIVENRERRINVSIGDQSGFKATIQAPLRRIHKVIRPGDIAEGLVLSQQPDLQTIAKITDIYIPQHNLWVGEYPYLRRDVFTSVSEELGGNPRQAPSSQPRPNSVKRRRRF